MKKINKLLSAALFRHIHDFLSFQKSPRRCDGFVDPSKEKSIFTFQCGIHRVEKRRYFFVYFKQLLIRTFQCRFFHLSHSFFHFWNSKKTLEKSFEIIKLIFHLERRRRRDGHKQWKHCLNFTSFLILDSSYLSVALESEINSRSFLYVSLDSPVKCFVRFITPLK